MKKINIIDISKYKESRIESYIAILDEYLKNQKGLVPLSRRNICNVGRLFLCFTFRSRNLCLSRIKTKDIMAFINWYAQGRSPARIQNIASQLRSFLRFLKFKGWTTIDFSIAVPPVAVWRQDRIPEFLTEKEVIQLLKSCDKNTLIGLRDYTILCLILNLGLRACEVSALTLEDLDWDTSTMIIHGKGPKISTLPLMQDMGDVLATYLLKGRPHCSLRNFFVSVKEPFCALTALEVSNIVGVALKQAGLKKRGKAHLLRHTLATSLLNKGASLQEIGEVLRHQSIDTTTIYAKVDFNRLRLLACPWSKKWRFGGSL